MNRQALRIAKEIAQEGDALLQEIFAIRGSTIQVTKRKVLR